MLAVRNEPGTLVGGTRGLGWMKTACCAIFTTVVGDCMELLQSRVGHNAVERITTKNGSSSFSLHPLKMGKASLCSL